MAEIKVWTISNEDEGSGYTVDEYGLDLFYNEITADTESEEASKLDPVGFQEQLMAMEPDKSISFGIWQISCRLMDDKEFENLPEWDGW